MNKNRRLIDGVNLKVGIHRLDNNVGTIEINGTVYNYTDNKCNG